MYHYLCLGGGGGVGIVIIRGVGNQPEIGFPIITKICFGNGTLICSWRSAQVFHVKFLAPLNKVCIFRLKMNFKLNGIIIWHWLFLRSPEIAQQMLVCIETKVSGKCVTTTKKTLNTLQLLNRTKRWVNYSRYNPPKFLMTCNTQLSDEFQCLQSIKNTLFVTITCIMF